MDTLKEIIRNLAFILLLATLLELLLPTTSLRGFVQLVMGFFVIVAVLQPLAALLELSFTETLPAWVETTAAETPLLAPEGQSQNVGQNAVRDQYRRILTQEIKGVAEVQAGVREARIEVELGEDRGSYLDYPPLTKVRVDVYRAVAAVGFVEPVQIGPQEGSENEDVWADAAGEATEPILNDFERKVRDAIADVMQISPDLIEVRERGS